jgi:NitT/TauT family transport system substrate-binding protein
MSLESKRMIKMKNMRKEIWIAIVLIGILIIAGSFYWNSQSKDSMNETPVKIAVNQWPGFAHVFIAEEKGFFEKNNVKVELVFGIEYSKAQERYINGEADGVIEAFSDTIFHNSEGIKTSVVYIADYSDEGDAIIGKSSLNSLADLKGKKVGVDEINGFSHIFVLASLEKVGLKESEIQIENVPAQQVLDALESGKIDAGHTWEPIKSAALAKGYKQLGKAGDIPGIITDVLVFNDKIIEERPEDIQAIVKSILEAKEFLDKNPEEAIKIMAEKEEMSEEEMNSGLKGVHQLNLNENIEAMKKSEETTSLYASGKIIADFYIERGQLSSMPDFDSIIEPRFVNNMG